MKKYRKIWLWCGGIFLLGLALFIYAYLLPAYEGYSGAGMSGLPAAFMIIAALILMGAGLLIAGGMIVFLFVSKHFFRER